MKKHKELCKACGASMMVNKYTMNKTLVNALLKVIRNPGRKANEIGFTKSEYSVYTKLKYWGMIERQMILGQAVDGLWNPTPKAYKFLRNEISVTKEISYFRNELHGVSKQQIYCDDIFATPESKQKYRDMMTTLGDANGN